MKKLNSHFRLLCLSILGLSLFACTKGEYAKVPMEQFEGLWELQGRSMLDGIRVRIAKSDEGYEGKVEKINDDKYVKMFLELEDKWVTKIERSSNFEFKLTEKKIGSGLFSIYGLETSTQYQVGFIHQDTLGLSTNTDPIKSKVWYVRVKE